MAEPPDGDVVALLCSLAAEADRRTFEDLYIGVSKSLLPLSDYDATAVEKAAAAASPERFQEVLHGLLKPFVLPTEHLSNSVSARRVKDFVLSSGPSGLRVRPPEEISCGCARPLRRPAEASRRRSRAGSDEIGVRHEPQSSEDLSVGHAAAGPSADPSADTGAGVRRHIPPRPSSPKPGQSSGMARMGGLSVAGAALAATSPHTSSVSPIDRIQATLSQRLGNGATPPSASQMILSPSPPQRPPSRGFRRASAPEISEFDAVAAAHYGRAVDGSDAHSEPSPHLSSSFPSALEPLAAIRGLLHAHTSKGGAPAAPSSAPPNGLRVPRGRRGSRSPSPAVASGDDGAGSGLDSNRKDPAHGRRRGHRREHAPDSHARSRGASDGISGGDSFGSTGRSPSPSHSRTRREERPPRGRSHSVASSSGAESDASGAAHGHGSLAQLSEGEDGPAPHMLPPVLQPADYMPPRPGSARAGRRRTSTPSLYVMSSDQQGRSLDLTNGPPSARLSARRGSGSSAAAARCMSPPPPQRAQAARTQTAHGTGVNFVKSRRRSVHAPLLPSVQESTPGENAPPPLASA